MTPPADPARERRPGSLRLAFAALGAPAAWAAHLGFSYLLVPESCRWGTDLVLHLVTVAAALVAVAATVTASRVLRGAGDDASARFVGVGGVAVGLLFLAAVLVEGLLPFLLDPCR